MNWAVYGDLKIELTFEDERLRISSSTFSFWFENRIVRRSAALIVEISPITIDFAILRRFGDLSIMRQIRVTDSIIPTVSGISFDSMTLNGSISDRNITTESLVASDMTWR